MMVKVAELGKQEVRTQIQACLLGEVGAGCHVRKCSVYIMWEVVTLYQGSAQRFLCTQSTLGYSKAQNSLWTVGISSPPVIPEGT